MAKWTGIVLIAAALVIAIASVIVAAHRNLTGLENVLFQVLILGIGLSGSYLFGRESARTAARDLIKPHARSAFRRLISLYRSLRRIAETIQDNRPSNNSDPVPSSVLDKLEGSVIEQICTVDDALEDWRDIVPEDVEELRARLTQKPTLESEE